MIPSIEVRTVPVARLKPAPYNPRRTLAPGDRRYQKLERSLREFGLVEPLIWNETTGHVVGGHARLTILKSMNVRRVPVAVVRLSDDREKALNIVLNNLEAQGQYNTGRLADLLEELAELPELEMTGFDRRDLADLRLEPLGDLPALEPGGDVEVTLSMDASTYEQLAPRLDALVREFDLVSHVARK